MRALLIQLGEPSAAPRAEAEGDAAFLLEQGYEVTVLASTFPGWYRVPEEVRTVELAPLESTSLLNRTERFVLFSIPSGGIRMFRGPASRIGRLRGVGRPFRMLVAVLTKLRSKQEGLSRLVHRRWWTRPYRVVRPWLLWRLTRRFLADELVDWNPDLVVVYDREVSLCVGWHLARLMPHARFSFGLDRYELSAAVQPAPQSDVA